MGSWVLGVTLGTRNEGLRGVEKDHGGDLRFSGILRAGQS